MRDTIILGDFLGTFHDKKVNRFFQVRGQPQGFFRKKVTCSGYCEYYNDTRTTTRIQELSPERIKKCVRIDKPRKHPKYCTRNKIGWKVREKKVKK